MSDLGIGFAGNFAMLLFAGAAVLAMMRLIAGPGVADRVVAADALAIITTAALVWLAGALDRIIYLDIALVYGALAFVGVVAIARALERRLDKAGE